MMIEESSTAINNRKHDQVANTHHPVAVYIGAVNVVSTIALLKYAGLDVLDVYIGNVHKKRKDKGARSGSIRETDHLIGRKWWPSNDKKQRNDINHLISKYATAD
jgi:hypothetical protein